MSSRPLFAPVYADAASGDERRAHDRRSTDRRAARRTFDPLFAATLVNQVAAKEETARVPAYPARQPRAGIAFNLSV